MSELATITISIKDLRSVLIWAEVWAFRMRKTRPEMQIELRRIAESIETQAGVKLTVASNLAGIEGT